MNRYRRFQTGESGRVWVGDLLRVYTGRVRGRGWGYNGEHHTGPGAWTVDDVRKSLQPKASTDMVLLSTVLHNVTVFGCVADDVTPQQFNGTIEFVPPSAELTLTPLVPEVVS